MTFSIINIHNKFVSIFLKNNTLLKLLTAKTADSTRIKLLYN